VAGAKGQSGAELKVTLLPVEKARAFASKARLKTAFEIDCYGIRSG